MADSGGSDWEVVSLTASTYAAAPGPIPIPIDAAADKTESPLLLLPNPPSPPAHFFMSQHFNLPPLFGTHLDNNKGGQELQESGPAVPDGDDSDHLNMPICPENYRHTERDDVLVLASPAGNGLQLQVGGGGGGGDELKQTTTPCSLPDANAGSDAAADVGSAPAGTVPVAAPSGGMGACNAAQSQAWWEKTYSFPRQDGSGGTQPLLAFRFVFVAGKLQLQEDHLSPVTEFGGVNSQTQKISCAVNEPLGEVKVGVLGGGSPVAQHG
ncbi:hypothetical protein ACQJBY_037860 [Aegilops geniculata]